MKILAQYEVPVYREPGYRYRDHTQSDPEVIIFLTLTVIFTIAIWSWISWQLPSKAGYRGAVRWIWFWTLLFPLTTGWSLITFLLLPWPIQKQLKQIVQAPSPAPKLKPISDIDEEMDRLRRGM